MKDDCDKDCENCNIVQECDFIVTNPVKDDCNNDCSCCDQPHTCEANVYRPTY